MKSSFFVNSLAIALSSSYSVSYLIPFSKRYFSYPIKDEDLENAEQKEDDGTNKLRICTIHASKGREWDEVYIPDVNEGNMPHKRAVGKEEIEEERRLFYVAMTRAKEKL